MKDTKIVFKSIAKIVLTFTLLLGISFSLEGCGETQKENYTSLSQMEDKRIGVLTGSSHSECVANALPNATRVYYQSTSDLYLALMQDKVDAFAESEVIFNDIKSAQGGIDRIDTAIASTQQATVFPKDSELGKEYNDFLTKLNDSGMLEKIHDDWFYNDFSDIDKTPGDNSSGVIKLAAYNDGYPFVYYEDGEIKGYELDLMYRFAREYNYALDIENPASVSSCIVGISSGKYDAAIGDIDITEERKQNFYFSLPTSSNNIILIVKDYSSEEQESFFDNIKESFRRTVIEEKRYLLILEGTLNTLIISICSIVIGFAIGFLLYLATRKNNKIFIALTKIYHWIIVAIPTLVLLMIVYYIVFANSSISSFAVSIVVFSFTFGMASYTCIKTSIDTIDKVQIESALSLGYTELKAFIRVVIPQALRVFIPIFKNEIVNLIKATSIIGYIAAQDLTKVGDIIRSRTFDAFFPLIIVALIYAIIIIIIIFAINRINVASDPKLRSKERILEGVKRHD